MGTEVLFFIVVVIGIGILVRRGSQAPTIERSTPAPPPAEPELSAAERQRLEAEARDSHDQLRTALAALLGSEYLAESEVAAWAEANAQVLALAKNDRFIRYLPGPVATQAKKCCQQLRNLTATVETHNQQFIVKRLQEERSAFDAFEQYPLSKRQRVAIVTNQDTTLVIAGAGTGKTSTIIGKVDYLIRRKLAASDEILVLAFARKASDELKERLAKLSGHSRVEVSTFHALGLNIVSEVEGKRPAVSKLAEDKEALPRFIRTCVTEMLAQPEYRKLLVAFFSALLDEEPPGADAATGDAFIRAQKTRGLRALTGTKLRSREEVQIANWLTLNGIAWEYERAYPFVTGTANRRQYKPDFYLSDYDLYLEHFGIDRLGNTRPGIDPERYRQQMQWKRALHRDHQTALIETFSYFAEEGGLIPRLEALLRAHGIEPRPLTAEQIRVIVAEGSRPFSDFVKLLAQFLNLFKSNGCSLEITANKARSERDRVFLRLFEHVFERYRAELRRTEEIDFNDMINRARTYVREGRDSRRFRYLIVDEFQDISANRLGLLQDLRACVPHSRLFAVGDDWQAIYRFTGSDVGIITDLSRHVGMTERVDLDVTFRYHQELLDFSSRFVTRNPLQLQKNLRAHHGSQGKLPVCIVFQQPDQEGGLRTALETACHDLLASQAGAPASVFILGRYGFNRPDHFAELCRQLQRPGITVDYSTAHGSKGKEADYVIVVGLEAGEYGFPSNVSDDPVLEMVLTQAEPFPYAEERRLFYVALTRARKRVYLIVPEDNASTFVQQDILESDLYEYVETIGTISERFRCPICAGTTIRRTKGPYGAFWACSHYPLCEGKLDTCPNCPGDGILAPIIESTRVAVYRCTGCSREAECCPHCKRGYLRERDGPYGGFLACSQWNGGAGCSYTRSLNRQRATGSFSPVDP